MNQAIALLSLGIALTATTARAEGAPEAPAPGSALAPAAPPAPPMKNRSLALMVVGIIAVPAGAVMAAGGGLVLLLCGTTIPDEDVKGHRRCIGTGVGLLVPGLLLIGGGFAAVVIGETKVPATSVRSPWVPAVGLGPGAGALRWTF